MKPVFGNDASNYDRPEYEEPEQYSQCAWRGCTRQPWDDLDLPVCFDHALKVRKRLDEELLRAPRGVPPDWIEPYVYYVMVAPTVVKIGYTRNLPSRLTSLRKDLDDVVAIEIGDRELETKRHRQFHTERLGRREDFELSRRLIEHIESLRPSMTYVIRRAMGAKALDNQR